MSIATGWAILILSLLLTISGCNSIPAANLDEAVKKEVKKEVDTIRVEEIKKANDRVEGRSKDVDNKIDLILSILCAKDPVPCNDKRLKALEDKMKTDESKGKKQESTPPAKSLEKSSEKTPEKSDKSNPAENPFFGKLGFGLGVGSVITIGRDRISSATTDGTGIVRIDKEENFTPGVFLESHLLLKTCEWGWDAICGEEEAKSRWANGPFISLTPGEAPLIKAVGIGWMIGYRYSDDKDSKRSFNFGVGLAIQPNSKTLGDGLNPNQPLPAKDTIRYQDRTLAGLIFMISHAF